MLIPCEVAIKTVLPSIRALMARNLLQKHRMREGQVAELLGVSQSAVSKYFQKARGTAVPIDNQVEVQAIVGQMISLLIHEPNKKMEIMKLFCQACALIRKKGLMCPFCQQNAPRTETDNCDFCKSQ